MRDSNGIHFDVTASVEQAEREFVQYRINTIRELNKIENESERLQAKLRQLSDSQLSGLGSDVTEGKIDRAIIGEEYWLSTRKDAAEAGTAVKKFSKEATEGLDGFHRSVRGGRSQVGQYIEALAQGDIGELLGEIAQGGSAAGIGVAAFALAAGGAIIGLAALTSHLTENVREVDKLAREHKLAAVQIQALQVYAARTGESVDDLAKNYKKLGPEIKQIERLVKESGAAIDNELRASVRNAEAAWQDLQLSATGALNTIGKELLPVVTVALQDMSSFIRSLNPTFKSAAAEAADFFIDVIVFAREASFEVRMLASGIDKIFIPDESADTVGKVIDKWKSGASDIGKALKGDMGGIRAEVEGRVKKLREEAAASKGGPKYPSYGGGGGSSRGKEDISETEKELRLLRAAEAEARDLLDGRRASVEA